MTKALELQWIDTAILTLGQASYLGPWFRENRDTFRRAIISDLPPAAMMPTDAAREAERIIADARTEAEAIIARARQTATETIDSARQKARTIQTDARGALERLARTIDY